MLTLPLDCQASARRLPASVNTGEEEALKPEQWANTPDVFPLQRVSLPAHFVTSPELGDLE